MEINGQKYEVIGTKQFTHNGAVRTEVTLRKPHGKKLYTVVVYENGAMSEVV